MLTTAQIIELFRMGTLNGKPIDRSPIAPTSDRAAQYKRLTVTINEIPYQITQIFPYKENAQEAAKTHPGIIVNYKIEPLKVTPGTVHEIATLLLPPDQIDHHTSDLYIKASPEADQIIKCLQPKSLLSSFISQIDNCKWYDLPFCYDPTIKEVQ